MIRSALSFFLLLVILTAFFPELTAAIIALITRVVELLLRVVEQLAAQTLV